jgi:hypothetical protein
VVVVGSLVGGVVGLVVVLELPTGGGMVAPVPDEVPVPQVELLPLVAPVVPVPVPVPVALGEDAPVPMVEVPLVVPMSLLVDLHATSARAISPPSSNPWY